MGVTIKDHFEIYKCFLQKDSIGKVIKGKFSYGTGEIGIPPGRVGANRPAHKITISEDGQSFVIDLGDIADQDQVSVLIIKYVLNYDPVDGELLKNDALHGR